MICSKVIAWLLCLALFAGAVKSQDKLPSNSDALKKKIASVSLIYKRTLLRQYNELISSLEKDIEAFREARAEGGTAEALAEIDRGIEQTNKELASATEMARSLRAELQQDATASVAPEASSANPLNLPCNCLDILNREGMRPEAIQQAELDLKNKLPAGLIWCGAAGQNELSVQKFAEFAAPILWFSPNEPIPLEKIPEPLPGHKINSPVVYYRISDLLLHSTVPKSAVKGSEKIQLEQIRGLTIKYYFYYSIDSGFNDHRHDLESVRLDIHFTRRNEKGEEIDANNRATRSNYVAHIDRVSGAAHGVTWYANQLDIGTKQKDTSLPITVLIEEGKHATSPDRNADGFYSPGYDVNRRYTDAWGVRDLIGSGELGSAKYEGSMTKPRRPEHMVKVRPSNDDTRKCLLQPYTGEYKDLLAKSTREYTLTPAKVFETKAEVEARRKKEEQSYPEQAGKKDDDDDEDKIAGWMKREKFGQKPKKKYEDPWLLKALRWGTGIERNEEFLDAIPIAYRAEGRQHGFTILPPVFKYKPFFGGYVLPKLNFMFSSTLEGANPGGTTLDRPLRFSLEGLYTPSAARTFDWYATSGVEWARPSSGRSYEGRLVNEGGFRFRFNRASLLLGGRVGLRVTGFAQARAPRFIFEFGTGAF